MRTKDKLARDLRADSAPQWMIKNATNGYYDDYESELAYPITQLVSDCERVGLVRIATRARNGGYDSTKSEAELWYDKQELPDTTTREARQ